MASTSSKKKASKRRLASWVLSDLYRLASVINAGGREIDAGAWLKVGANVLSSAPAGKEALTRAAPARWGLDHTSLLVFAQRCGLCVTTDEIAAQVTSTLAWRAAEAERIGRAHHVPMSGETIGRLLEITESDRRVAQAWRVGTVDGTPETRAQAAKKTHAAREEQRRRAAGVKTRVEYLDTCPARTKPWESAGMSRSKWYRIGGNHTAGAEKNHETGPCETGPCVNNKDRETGPCANNIIKGEIAGSPYGLPSRGENATETPVPTLAEMAEIMRNRRTHEPVAPYTRADILPGGLAARALANALSNPPNRTPFRAGRAQRAPAADATMRANFRSSL